MADTIKDDYLANAVKKAVSTEGKPELKLDSKQEDSTTPPTLTKSQKEAHPIPAIDDVVPANSPK